MIDDAPRRGPFAGYESLDEAIEGLRRARFRVLRSVRLESVGLVIEGDVTEGAVRPGMVLLPHVSHYDNLLTPVPIKAVESLLHSGGVEHLGLVIGQEPPDAIDIAEGTVLDVLQHSPA